jgi:hypothetical protein
MIVFKPKRLQRVVAISQRVRYLLFRVVPEFVSVKFG